VEDVVDRFAEDGGEGVAEWLIRRGLHEGFVVVDGFPVYFVSITSAILEQVSTY
jgi:hypothetical protein